eukprot:352223-Chlamydomonas_euryale.AAC.15
MGSTPAGPAGSKAGWAQTAGLWAGEPVSCQQRVQRWSAPPPHIVHGRVKVRAWPLRLRRVFVNARIWAGLAPSKECE